MKERLIGACVLVALAVIFIPMLFDHSSSNGQMVTRDLKLSSSQPRVSGAVELSLTHDTPPHAVLSSTKQANNSNQHNVPNRIQRKQPTASAHSREAGAKTAKKPVVTPPSVATSPRGKQDAEGWAVQAGSFTHKDNARTLTRRLKDSGLSAYVQAAQSGGTHVYRVRVGPFGKRSQAQRKTVAITAVTGNASQVVSNP